MFAVWLDYRASAWDEYMTMAALGAIVCIVGAWLEWRRGSERSERERALEDELRGRDRADLERMRADHDALVERVAALEAGDAD